MVLNNESGDVSGLGSSLGLGGLGFGILGLGAPLLAIQDNEADNNNLLHDQYNVFVNSDYIGKKILLSDNEKPNDLEKYLHAQGFENFQTDISKADITIHCTDKVDKMESILNSYLNTR